MKGSLTEVRFWNFKKRIYLFYNIQYLILDYYYKIYVHKNKRKHKSHV